jgi:hypothetical protein
MRADRVAQRIAPVPHQQIGHVREQRDRGDTIDLARYAIGVALEVLEDMGEKGRPLVPVPGHLHQLVIADQVSDFAAIKGEELVQLASFSCRA